MMVTDFIGGHWLGLILGIIVGFLLDRLYHRVRG
jgi:uncharacterized membrane-anchored protein YhcB (DUF1043 family)